MKSRRISVLAALAAVLVIALFGGRRFPVPRASGVGQELLPDLTIDGNILKNSIRFETARFTRRDCAVVEGCVNAAGRRRLLRFTVFTPNIGTADLFMGDPEGNPLFEYSPCHGHYHFNGYADYELMDSTGTTIVAGRKQAFCLLDSVMIDPEAGPRQFDCHYQGISKGWADVYDSSLDCQWLDITDVPPGQYQLHVNINPDAILNESNLNNNSASTPVRVRPVMLP
jgi:hypothetical protein